MGLDILLDVAAKELQFLKEMEAKCQKYKIEDHDGILYMYVRDKNIVEWRSLWEVLMHPKYGATLAINIVRTEGPAFGAYLHGLLMQERRLLAAAI